MKKVSVLLFAIVALCMSANAEPLQLSVSMGVPTYEQTTNTSGQITYVTYRIPIIIETILSYGHLGQTAGLSVFANDVNAVTFTLQNSSAPTVDDTVSVVSSAFESIDAPVTNGYFLLEEGTVRHFVLTVIIINPAKPNSSYRVSVNQLRVLHLGIPSAAMNIDLLPTDKFQTGYCFINGSAPSSVNENISNDLMQISSCPAGIRVFTNNDAVVEVYSISGQKVLTASVPKGEAQIFSSLAPGVYTVKSSIKGHTVIKKAIVN